MAKEKVDNFTENVNLDSETASDNTDETQPIDLDEFFGGLERTVTGAMFDEGEPTYSKGNTEGQTVQSEEDSERVAKPDEVEAELAKLKKRYSDSSRESKKLAAKLKEYEEYDQFIPVLQVMREDPNLLNQVRGYLKDGATPQSIIKNLDISEDFVFDGDEAMRDPDSDSAKVFNATVDAAVTRRLSLAKQKEQEAKRVDGARQKEQEAILAFQEQHGLSDDDMDEFLSWAREEPLTLDHLWLLKNRDRRDRDIINGTFEERQQQMQRMKQTPRTLGGKNAPSSTRSEDDAVFDAILSVSNSGVIFKD